MTRRDTFSLSFLCILLSVNLIICFSSPFCPGTETNAGNSWTAKLYYPSNLFFKEPICFALGNTRMQYEAAQSACATLSHGRLLTLDSLGKQMIFTSLIDVHAPSLKREDYWLGLVKIPGSQDWKWSDPNQSRMTYDNWGFEEPDVTHPFSIVTYADRDDFWATTHVLDEHLTFCEYSPHFGPPPTPLSPTPMPTLPNPTSGSASPVPSPSQRPQPNFHSTDFLYQRTNHLNSSFGSRISSSRSVMECASSCAGAVTCHGFGFQLTDNTCIVFTWDSNAQSTIPDCNIDRCYHKINVLFA